MEPFTDVETLLRYKAKAVLRQRARSLRNTLPAEALTQRSAAICKAVLVLPEIAKAGTVALFYPIEQRREVDLRPLDAMLRDQKKRLAYPAIDRATRVMTFRFVDELKDLEERGNVFREPP